MSPRDDLRSFAARLAEPLSADGRTALATLREGDAPLFDALLGETVIEDGAPDVRGPLRDACHRSTTNYDGLYDTYITDRCVYAQPLIEVLAAAPSASRAAALRDELTSLRSLHSPPTTLPEHVVDLRPLGVFPRLRSLAELDVLAYDLTSRRCPRCAPPRSAHGTGSSCTPSRRSESSPYGQAPISAHCPPAGTAKR